MTLRPAEAAVNEKAAQGLLRCGWQRTSHFSSLTNRLISRRTSRGLPHRPQDAGQRSRWKNGKPIVTHGGAWAAYRAELLRVPGEKLVVVCLCNRDDLAPQQLARRIALAALRAP